MAKRADSAVQSEFLHPTAVALASALGLHRNTLSAYRRQGAPPGPPYCELQWRVWLAGQGHADLAAPSAALGERLTRAGVAGYQAAAANGSAASESPVQIDWREAAEKAKAQVAELDARRKLDEYERQCRKQMHIDDARRVLLASAPAITSGLSDLVNVAGELFPDDRVAQDRARALIIQRLHNLRGTLVARIEEELAKWVAEATP